MKVLFGGLVLSTVLGACIGGVLGGIAFSALATRALGGRRHAA